MKEMIGKEFQKLYSVFLSYTKWAFGAILFATYFLFIGAISNISVITLLLIHIFISIPFLVLFITKKRTVFFQSRQANVLEEKSSQRSRLEKKLEETIYKPEKATLNLENTAIPKEPMPEVTDKRKEIETPPSRTKPKPAPDPLLVFYQELEILESQLKELSADEDLIEKAKKDFSDRADYYLKKKTYQQFPAIRRYCLHMAKRTLKERQEKQKDQKDRKIAG